MNGEGGPGTPDRGSQVGSTHERGAQESDAEDRKSTPYSTDTLASNSELFDPGRVIRASWLVRDDNNQLREQRYDLECTMPKAFADEINRRCDNDGVPRLYRRWDEVDLSDLRRPARATRRGAARALMTLLHLAAR